MKSAPDGWIGRRTVSGAETTLVGVAPLPSGPSQPGRLSSKNAASTTALIPNRAPSRTAAALVRRVRFGDHACLLRRAGEHLLLHRGHFAAGRARQVMPLSSVVTCGRWMARRG